MSPEDLPAPGRTRSRELHQLSTVTGMTTQEIRKALRRRSRAAPGGPVILKKGLGVDKVYYLRENQSSFPGVSVERVFTREYKHGDVAAHLFGNVGEVTAEQLKEPRYAGLHQGDAVGQSGIEYEYDRFLRGKPGTDRVQVDALGRPDRAAPGQAGPGRRRRPADDRLGPAELRGGRARLVRAAGRVRRDERPERRGPGDGLRPDLRPVDLHPPDHRRASTTRSPRRKTDAPLANRAIQGLYPTGSAFKPITATAALQDHLISPNTIFNDTGSLKVDGTTLHNAGHAINGPIDMSDALKVSSDIYFYNLGLKAKASKGGGQIQDWARQYGLGEKTGIDLPAEVDGLIPTPAWRNRLYHEHLTDRPWSVGDNINLAVGQGDLEADPLQMAVAYAALANGGTVLTPHLGRRRRERHRQVLQEIRPAPRRQLDISPTTRDTIMTGLTRAAMEPGGTSYPVFGHFPFADRGQDRNRPAPEPARPVLVHRARARQEPADRGRGDARARRVRRRHRRPGGRPHPRALLQPADHADGLEHGRGRTQE